MTNYIIKKYIINYNRNLEMYNKIYKCKKEDY